MTTLRPITWKDRVMTYGVLDLEERVIRLACRVVTIDGAPLTRQAADDMELTEAEPIIQSILAEIIAGLKSKGVA